MYQGVQEPLTAGTLVAEKGTTYCDRRIRDNNTNIEKRTGRWECPCLYSNNKLYSTYMSIYRARRYTTHPLLCTHTLLTPTSTVRHWHTPYSTWAVAARCIFTPQSAGSHQRSRDTDVSMATKAGALAMNEGESASVYGCVGM